MTSYRTDGTVGPWAREKLDRLKAYLDPYARILRTQNSWCEQVIYFDGFAGAGMAPLRASQVSETATPLFQDSPEGMNEDEEYIEYVLGSPFVALSLDVPFTDYFFVEKNKAKAAELEAFVEPFRGRCNISVLVSDADTAIQDEVVRSNRNWKKCRGVFFLDPFGLQVPWATIELLAKTGAIEVILNLPVGTAIQRFLPKSGEFSVEARQRLDEYFGDAGWYDIVYVPEPDLFGTSITKNSDAGRKLAEWYAQRMRQLFGQASSPRLITNENGGHLYYLVWAGPHKKGYEIAKYVLGPA